MPIHITSGDGRDILETGVLEIVPDATDTSGLKCRHLPELEPAERHAIIFTEKANLSEANPSAKICPI